MTGWRTTVADDGTGTAAPAEGTGDDLESRVGSLETGQTTLSGKIDQVLSILSGGRKQPEPPAAVQDGEPGADGLAMEIRRQLDERKAAEQADAEKASGAREIDALKQQVAALAERKPEPPVRRVEQVMWGKR
jgi:hypothetical protein